MQISQDAQGLVLSYPLWTGVALLAVAVVLLGCAVLARSRFRRRWAMSIAVMLAAWSGLYFLTFKATITDEAGSVYAFLRYDYRIPWKDAADIFLEQRGSGRDWHIVVIDRRRNAFDLNVAELSIDDRDRVMAYIVDRMPESAFRREPALMKRQAPQGARAVGWFGEQQI